MKRKPRTRTPGALSAAKLTEMIEEATTDAYGECEQATGWFTVIDDNLDMPFETHVLGVTVTVKRLELRADNSIVAVCARGPARLAVGIVDLPLPSPKPEGAEWIDAHFGHGDHTNRRMAITRFAAWRSERSDVSLGISSWPFWLV